jgi:hypothetical protein
MVYMAGQNSEMSVMLRLPKLRVVLRSTAVLPILLAALLMVLAPFHLSAQDDPDQIPLGDVARNLRKKTPQPSQPVIDDDNLPKVMEQAESHHNMDSALKYVMNGQEKGFHISVPDATCSLSFSANAKSLLSNQYAEMDLPAGDLAKLAGPAVIEGDTLMVNISNGTNWHLSELDVALTLVGKNESSQFQEVRPEKKPDATMIYRMRAAAAPWEKTVFTAPLNLELSPGAEWHWAIVQAKGYPPQDAAISAQR